MSHFEELCKLNEGIQQSRQNAEIILKREMVRLVRFYEKWLGVPILDPCYYSHLPPNEKVPYIETGISTDTLPFSPREIKNIDTNENVTLSVAIKTTIPSRYDNSVISLVHWRSHPDIGAQSVILELLMMLADKQGKKISIKINGKDATFVSVNEENDTDYHEVVCKMKTHIGEQLKNKTPYIFSDWLS